MSSVIRCNKYRLQIASQCFLMSSQQNQSWKSFTDVILFSALVSFKLVGFQTEFVCYNRFYVLNVYFLVYSRLYLDIWCRRNVPDYASTVTSTTVSLVVIQYME